MLRYCNHTTSTLVPQRPPPHQSDSQIASGVEDATNDPVEEPPSNPENAEVYMERVRSWQRELSRFGGVVYYRVAHSQLHFCYVPKARKILGI
uniref:Uncharacterized protein n=1 Tax=Terrapene triunguis TaxID=2587831 RepID=A0A674HY57_9SAUR